MTVDNLEIRLVGHRGSKRTDVYQNEVLGVLPNKTGEYNLCDGTPICLTVNPNEYGGIAINASIPENIDISEKPYLKSLVFGIEGVLVMGNGIQLRVSQTKTMMINRQRI